MVTQREATAAAKQVKQAFRAAQDIRRDRRERGIARLAHGVEEGMLALRDTAETSQDTTLKAIASLTDQLARLIDVLASNVPTVNVAAALPSNVTLEQQPVNVNVPEQVINVEAGKLPDSVIITHSDNSTSLIEFN